MCCRMYAYGTGTKAVYLKLSGWETSNMGFDIEEETAEAIQELAPMLKKVSAERIQVELVKLLTSVHPEEMHTRCV